MTRQEAIEWLTDIKCVTENWAQEEAVDMAIEALKTEPIRCKDCRWCQDDYMGTWCGRFSGVRFTNADDFCSHGERREE